MCLWRYQWSVPRVSFPSSKSTQRASQTPPGCDFPKTTRRQSPPGCDFPRPTFVRNLVRGEVDSGTGCPRSVAQRSRACSAKLLMGSVAGAHARRTRARLPSLHHLVSEANSGQRSDTSRPERNFHFRDLRSVRPWGFELGETTKCCPPLHWGTPGDKGVSSRVAHHSLEHLWKLRTPLHT